MSYILTREEMKRFMRDDRTPHEVVRITGLSISTVLKIERKLNMRLRRAPDKNWAIKDEFKHRKDAVKRYKIILGKWISNSPELRYNHGVA